MIHLICLITCFYNSSFYFSDSYLFYLCLFILISKQYVFLYSTRNQITAITKVKSFPSAFKFMFIYY